jgi:hypothetical protein
MQEEASARTAPAPAPPSLAAWVAKDTALIDRLAAAQPATAHRLVMGAQRKYGNRYVEGLLAGRAHAAGRGPAPDKDCGASDTSSECGCSACSGGKDRALAAAADRDTGGAGAPPVTAQAPTPAPAASKTISIYVVTLPGSTRSASTDVAKANTIWAQCSVKFDVAGTEKWTTGVLDKLDPKGVLNEFSSPKSPTVEETEMIAHQPGGKVIHVYYVPGMSAGSRGEAFRPSANPAFPKAVAISDSAASDTLAHELGHVLMDDGSHSSDPDNLMASGAIRNVGVDKLTSAQCAKV